jgi:Fungal chitosanase of glycosyl hydrolase group 75
MAFRPPPASKRQLTGVPFDQADDFAAAAKQRFDDFDSRPGNRDPSKCKALLRFPDGTIFWSAKMAIDADGPAAGPGRRNGKELDPASGQNQTSLRFATGRSLPSETVPYIVLPQSGPQSGKPFDPALNIGDLAVVIFKDKTTSAICADLGPHTKIGEASIRVHEALQQMGCPDPCSRRDANGFCVRVRNSSVDEDVLYFVFPGSAFPKSELEHGTVNTKVKERAFTLYNRLRGIT